MVASQQDYSLPSTAQKLERVEVKDQFGDYQIVLPIDKSQIEDIAMSEYYQDAGMPIYYDIVGRSLLLYPKPGSGYVTLSAGLKIYVSRDIVQFNSTATGTEPGFAINFHRILPIGACLDYAVGKKMFDSVNALKFLQEETKKDMEEFYSRRHRDPDAKARIHPSNETFI